jgi:hypothetical protein
VSPHEHAAGSGFTITALELSAAAAAAAMGFETTHMMDLRGNLAITGLNPSRPTIASM